MRTSIVHSGAVNEESRFTLRFVELIGPTITIDSTSATVRTELTEKELADLIFRARCALEECRLNTLFHNGGMSASEFDTAKQDLDKHGPPDEFFQVVEDTHESIGAESVGTEVYVGFYKTYQEAMSFAERMVSETRCDVIIYRCTTALGRSRIEHARLMASGYRAHV